MPSINLSELTNDGEVRNLAGHERGLAARGKFRLDELDRLTDAVDVVVPEEIYAISPSFFQGMFSESVQALGSKELFFRHYRFDTSISVLRQIESGIKSSLIERKSLLS